MRPLWAKALDYEVGKAREGVEPTRAQREVMRLRRIEQCARRLQEAYQVDEHGNAVGDHVARLHDLFEALS
ncbi:MAG TPA: hypothetical protein VD948_03935 [Rhodothermales bacterium]|nr:hypothetical protein [Rhodothermales bacterium]